LTTRGRADIVCDLFHKVWLFRHSSEGLRLVKTDDSVLVIGGGIAGMQAALDLADMGSKVYLVEKNPAIGGRMAQLDKTFPTNDCAI